MNVNQRLRQAAAALRFSSSRISMVGLLAILSLTHIEMERKRSDSGHDASNRGSDQEDDAS